MGLDTDMQLLMSGILNVTQLVGVCTSVWTMDTLGRRWLLLSGALLMTVCHVIIAVLVGLFSDNWPAHTAEGWASVAMLLLYMLGFGATWGPVGWSLPSGMPFLPRGITILPPWTTIEIRQRILIADPDVPRNISLIAPR